MEEGSTFHFTGNSDVDKEHDPAIRVISLQIILQRLVRAVSQCSQSYDGLEDSSTNNFLILHMK
jgi:hypothetical protein